MSIPVLYSRHLTRASVVRSAVPVTLRVYAVRVVRAGSHSHSHSASHAHARSSRRLYSSGATGQEGSSKPAEPRRWWKKRKTEEASEEEEYDLMTVLFPMMQSGGSIIKTALGISAGLGTVFAGGAVYMEWYKAKVLDQIEKSFAPGYDPALVLANLRQGVQVDIDSTSALADGDVTLEEHWTQRHRREEQNTIDAIVHGEEPGHYFMLLGPKGCGKGTMIIDAMNKIEADGVSIVEAHPDLEVFRLRLGKALDYEYSEDSQTGVFQRRDPREGGPCLDIERALNKLEKVAIRLAKKRGRPLVMVFNNVHYFNNDDQGRNLLLQIQQKAEAWAQSGCMTVVFSTDDSWPHFFLRKTASRMQTLSIPDLNAKQAISAAVYMHKTAGRSTEAHETYRAIADMVGGRLAYLKKAAHAKDMQAMAHRLVAHEKGWLLSQIGLIPDHDDDVMDEQKWSSCSWLLLREFVKLRQQQEKERDERIAAGDLKPEDADLPLPSIPYYKCREIMTRPDFLEQLDHTNIISIDVHHDVRPDSMLILHAAREVCEEEGFDEVLDSVRDRVDAIESLHRTRELTIKDVKVNDLVRLVRVMGGASPPEDPEDDGASKPRLV